MKREIRCKSGAIPVAVSETLNPPKADLKKFSNFKPLFLRRWEGVEKNRKPEDLPHQANIIQCFRVKS
jgi:hypothetical protein